MNLNIQDYKIIFFLNNTSTKVYYLIMCLYIYIQISDDHGKSLLFCLFCLKIIINVTKLFNKFKTMFITKNKN